MIDWGSLFLSLDYDTKDYYLGMLKDSNLLNDSELQVIKKFESLCSKVVKKPTINTLRSEIPEYPYVEEKVIKPDDLEDTVKLWIAKKKTALASQMCLDLSKNFTFSGIDENTLQTLDRLYDLVRTKVDDDSGYQNIMDNLKSIYEAKVDAKGILTGISDIDSKTGGFQPGTFNVIAAFAGHGKTTMAVNVSYKAILDGKNVCYFTLEVPKYDLFIDFLSRHSFQGKFTKQISHSDVKKKELTKEDADYFFDVVQKDFETLPGKVYVLDETEIDSYTFSCFEAKMRELDDLAAKETGHGLDLIVVDQAQLLKFSTNMSTVGMETSVINMFVSFFRQQAINFLKQKRQITVVMLSQINRDGLSYATKHGGAYTLTNLAEANELERASSMVITIFSDSGMREGNQVKVQLLKSRNGQTQQEPVTAYADFKYYVFGDDNCSTAASVANIDMADIPDTIPSNQNNGSGLSTINFDDMLGGSPL